MEKEKGPAEREAADNRKYAERLFAALYGTGGATLAYLEAPSRQFIAALDANTETGSGVEVLVRQVGPSIPRPEMVLLLAAAANAYAFEGKRARGRTRRVVEPWEILYGVPRKRFRSLRGRLEAAAKGSLRRRERIALAADLRAVSLSLSSTAELAGKLHKAPNWISLGTEAAGYPAWFARRYGSAGGTLYQEANSREAYIAAEDTGYPEFAQLADRLEKDDSEPAGAIAVALLKARDFIEKECLSDEGPNSPEKLKIATAIERVIVDHIRRVTDEPHFPQLAALLEMVERAATGTVSRFGPDGDNAENLRLRIHKLVTSDIRPVPAFNVFLLGARYLEKNSP